ncbi:hypothetical protein TD95_004305 [Thielaviopsis punctulata]|uniref:OPT family small oligopeptide transporter n=1 Tax=Thielaviopsis punctulata TaxID=72032 RepID=A0A0F4ZBG3_9PEZI|nr:hypothetical protein TD95_004305 [Thielaviopsis punctulata]
MDATTEKKQAEVDSLPLDGEVDALNATMDDLLEAKEIAASLSLDETINLLKAVYRQFHQDPNFPLQVINKIQDFLADESILENPEKHSAAIEEMKIEVALITNNSPYAEVRAVVDNHDDPSLPVSTIRAWTIGIFFAACIAFINAFFDPRMPSIYVVSTVPQLLAYPAGKAMERWFPDVGFTLCGVRHSLNPGPFNKKEHMLITIMSNVAKSVPYTNYIVWIQVLPKYFNQPYARSVGYQILVGLSTNFIGYGMAGICRRFLVYPAYCVWPTSLVTIALNTAFHDTSIEKTSVAGPLKSTWSMSRMRFFVYAFTAMFFYFFLPNYLMGVISYFSWMTWIAPNNATLEVITGAYSGMSLNPFSSFDWNVLTYMIDPLMAPFFSTFNLFMGAFLSMFVVLAIFYTNTYNTGYIPILSNLPFDHFGQSYNVSSILNDRGIFDAEKYAAYSPPFLSAGNLTVYMFFFSVYSATVTYGILYHRHEIMLGVRDFWDSVRGRTSSGPSENALDVHNRLMSKYKEVPEWWYAIVLVAAIAVGAAGIGAWPTHTSPAVVLYGVLLCIIFVIPVGIIMAMTGVEVTLNVLAEFIGGVWVEGNAIAMCYFKSYGYVTCAQALSFSADQKLMHYLKVAPRFTFWAQMVPTLISTFICVGVLQYQINIDKVCTADAPFRFTCPGINTFFTAAVLWGTVGPRKIWGKGGQYVATLLGFPLGVVLVLIFYFLGRRFPKSTFLRSVHPVVLLNGALLWSPYNLTYMWPAVPVAAFSWLYIKKRFLGLWSKYNYVLSAAFSCGVALSGIFIFFALQLPEVEVSWWGNNAIYKGWENGSYTHKTLSPGEYFGPRMGDFH